MTGLRVGDRVRVPGHGRRDPSSEGTLVEIVRVDYPRAGPGYFAKVRTDDGRVVTAARGLVWKVRGDDGKGK